MKRMFICLALVICLLAALTIGVSATEAAQLNAKTIDKVEVFYAEPVLGQKLPEVTIPANANYMIEYDWYDHTNDNGFIPNDTVAEKGHAYDISIYLSPADGYSFDSAAQVFVNGQEILEKEEYWLEVYEEEIYIDTPNYDFCDAIDEVRLTVVEPVVGQNFVMPTLTAEHCTLNDYSGWYEHSYEESTQLTGKVEKKWYYLSLALTADPGYSFTEDTKVYMNGTLLHLGEDYDFFAGWLELNALNYDFREKISSVAITLPEPVVGKAFPKPAVPNGANFTAEGDWYDRYDYAPVSGTVEKLVYDFEMTIYPKTGYAFTENTVFTVNGKRVEVEFYEGGVAANYAAMYDLAQKVNQFSVNYSMPVVGQKPGAITIPANAPYTLGENSGWRDSDTYEKVTGTFESGKHYTLAIDLELKKGYSVSENYEVLVNGKAWDNTYSETTALYIYDSKSFCTPIAKVELPAWPEVKVGDRLTGLEGEADHYTYFVYFATDDRVAKDGNLYYAYMEVNAKPGYEFNENTVFTIGGKKVIGQEFWDYNNIGFRKYYNFSSRPEIREVQLFATIPGAGQTGGAVTAAENCGYSVDEYAWGIYTRADYSDAALKEGPYKKGEKIIMVAYLETDEACLISPDCKVTLNGREYKIVEFDIGEDFMLITLDLGTVGEEQAPAYNGLVVVDGQWRYYKDGVFQGDYTGLVPYDGIQFYVENGILDFNYTGLVWYNEAWTYVANSQLTEGYTGLVWFEGEWFYTENSVIDWTFTGLVPYEGNMFYVQNNHLDFTYTGLAYLDGGWYYVENALLKPTYTGLTYFNDNWFYVVDGTIDWTFTGMVSYNDNLFYVQNNLLDWSYTGLGYHDGAWYYFQNALYTPSFTGLVPFNGSLFYVKDGTIDWSFNGEAEYDGITYTVIAGLVTL